MLLCLRIVWGKCNPGLTWAWPICPSQGLDLAWPGEYQCQMTRSTLYMCGSMLWSTTSLRQDTHGKTVKPPWRRTVGRQMSTSLAKISLGESFNCEVPDLLPFLILRTPDFMPSIGQRFWWLPIYLYQNKLLLMHIGLWISKRCQKV